MKDTIDKLIHEAASLGRAAIGDISQPPSDLIRSRVDGLKKEVLTKLETYQQRVPVGTAIILLCQGSVVVGRRKGGPGAGEWSFPGGTFEQKDMSLEDGAARELFEETGLVVYPKRLQHLASVLGSERPDTRRWLTVFFWYESDVPFEALNLEPEKCEGWVWVDLQDFEQLHPLYGAIRPLLGTKEWQQWFVVHCSQARAHTVPKCEHPNMIRDSRDGGSWCPDCGACG
jgi:8-oxo-dGTP diphosphatase